MTDHLEALERLQRLREAGTLTEGEFAAEKTRILSGAGIPAARVKTAAVRDKGHAPRRRSFWLVTGGALTLLGATAAAAMWLGTPITPNGAPGGDHDKAAATATERPAETQNVPASSQSQPKLTAAAPSIKIDMAAVNRKIADLEENYLGVLSDISCEAPTLPAHVLMCDSSEETPSASPNLWLMGRLDTLAWAYAYENATKVEIDQENPPLDPPFIAARDACTTADCLRTVLIKHTNDSLGGMSPYEQR